MRAQLRPQVLVKIKQQPPPPFYGHYTGQPALASTSSLELQDFVGAKFFCLHALLTANSGNQTTMKA